MPADGIDFPGYSPKPQVERLAIREVDAASGCWRDVDAAADGRPARSLTLVTFNTWFQGPEHALRYQGLLEVLEAADADIIMLQEVTVRLLDALMSAPWVRERYCIAHAPIRADAIPSHGLALLARPRPLGATLHPLPTHMGRKLLVADFLLDGKRFAVATAHLESMKSNADVRGAQLAAIFGILEEADPAVLCGDFNFCSSWRAENDRIDARYLDVWPRLSGEPGFTQDTARNRMLAIAKAETKQVRIDRILLRSHGAERWAPAAVALLGTQPVRPENPKVFPSDHFGVAATIVSC